MTGEQLKMEGIERVKANNKVWMVVADEAMWRLATTKLEFTTEDLKAIVCNPQHPNAYGAAFNTAARAGLIKRVGYRPSTSPSAHGRIVSVWTKA